ncbi:hypothetical protein V8F06_007681 [Rhypophila decipiens]
MFFPLLVFFCFMFFPFSFSSFPHKHRTVIKSNASAKTMVLRGWLFRPIQRSLRPRRRIRKVEVSHFTHPQPSLARPLSPYPISARSTTRTRFRKPGIPLTALRFHMCPTDDSTSEVECANKQMRGASQGTELTPVEVNMTGRDPLFNSESGYLPSIHAVVFLGRTSILKTHQCPKIPARQNQEEKVNTTVPASHSSKDAHGAFHVGKNAVHDISILSCREAHP